MKQSTRIAITVAPILLAFGLFAGSLSAQTLSGLQLRPSDTAEAERVRIWIPVERRGRCRVSVEIRDASGKVIRHLFNALLGAGYYNFYWDKRDDSGYRVDPGKYAFFVDNCGDKRMGTVEARYSQWEKSVRLEPYDPDDPFRLGVTVTADSVPASMYILDRRDRVRDSVFVDSVFSAGTYEWRFDPTGNRIDRGNYQIKIVVGDWHYRREVTYLP